MKMATKIFMLVVVGLQAENILSQDLDLTTYPWDVPVGAHNKVELVTGTGEEKQEGESVNVDFVFGRSQTSLGDSETAKWGITCNEKNSCTYEKLPEASDYIYNSQFNYKTADLHLRLQNEKIEADKDKAPKIVTQLVTGGNKWPLKDVGVVGLSPQGSFANYLRATYSTDTSFVFKYEPINREENEISFELYAVVNPKFEEKSVVFEKKFSKTDEHWMIKGDLSLPNTSIDFKDADICLTNQDSNIIVTSNAFIQCDEIKKIICDGKVGLDCTNSNADYSKAKDLKVKIGKLEVSFKPEDYLFVNKENKNMIECRIGDPETIRSMELCDKNTEFALGKLFYEKYFPVITYQRDGNSVIRFIDTYEFNKKIRPASWLKYWWILLILLIIVILVFVVMKSRKKDDVEVEDGGDYVRAE